MNIQCSNGHFYDNSQYSSCPYCAKARETAGPAVGFDRTVGFSDQPQVGFSGGFGGQPGALPGFGPATETVPLGTQVPEDDKTISAVGAGFDADPVVGWLVCIQGAAKGVDYRLRVGRNFIGRGDNMTVSIKGDRSISSDRHAIVSYDHIGNCFYVMPGASTQLFYLNGKVVLENMRLKSGDILTLGNTKLMFIPFCTDSFSWQNEQE